uniref:BZIP domain-containing protein n=1 Tax=Peronospora matthiolae TaxID=2874970 RepID=A0AAV1UHA8_9STRA
MTTGSTVVVVKGLVGSEPDTTASRKDATRALKDEPDEMKPDALVVSNDLAASVLTACFPTATFTDVVGDYHDRLCKRDEHGPVTSNEVVPVPKSRREREAIRKRVYHQKVKDERNRLRQTVDDLARQLSDLQAGKQARAAAATDSLSHLQRRLAHDEREKLWRAEEQQKRLLAEAETKANCIEALCRQLTLELPKGSRTALTTTARSRSRALSSRVSPEFDYTMFRGHLRRVHESYAIVDEIFDREKSMTEGIVSSVKRRETDGEVEYFEHRSNYTQPFCYPRTEQIMWKLAKLLHRQDDREEFGEVAESDDTLVVRFRLLHTLTCGSTVSVLQRQVGRRFVEKNRTIIVWKSHTEGEEIFRGMHADETGWVSLTPGADEGTTDVKMCVRQVPMKLILSSSGGDARVEEFHDLLQSSVSEDISEVTSDLDKLLLEDTLAGIDI